MSELWLAGGGGVLSDRVEVAGVTCPSQWDGEGVSRHWLGGVRERGQWRRSGGAG